jgi:diacylglycerol kinase family enzyme
MGIPQSALTGRPTGAGVLIVRNPSSGTDVIRRDPSALLAERLPEARVHDLGEDETLDDAVSAALASADPPSVLGVLGGDGSVSRMAHLARRHGMPLLVLPGGTFNHFARAVGVDSVEAALDALAAGTGVWVAAAEVSTDGGDPVTVLNAASIGTYPQVIAEREDRMDHFGKWVGGVIATWRALRGAVPVTIERGGRRARVWSVFVSVGRNAPDQVATIQRQTIDDPVLDIRVHHARGSRLRAVASLAFGRRSTAFLRAVRLMPRNSDLERILAPDLELRIRPEPGGPPVYVHDGELEQESPDGWTLRCAIIPKALEVYAPAAPRAE